jgi:hypothetical protein
MSMNASLVVMDRFFDQEHPTVVVDVEIPDMGEAALRDLHTRFGDAVKAHGSNYIAGIARVSADAYSVQVYGRRGGPTVSPSEAAPLFRGIFLEIAGIGSTP